MIAVEDDDGRNTGYTERIGKFPPRVLEDGKGHVFITRMPGDLVEVFVFVGVDGEEQNLLVAQILLSLDQFGQVEIGNRAIRTDKSENDGPRAFEILNGPPVAAQVAQRPAARESLTDADVFNGRLGADGGRRPVPGETKQKRREEQSAA